MSQDELLNSLISELRNRLKEDTSNSLIADLNAKINELSKKNAILQDQMNGVNKIGGAEPEMASEPAQTLQKEQKMHFQQAEIKQEIEPPESIINSAIADLNIRQQVEKEFPTTFMDLERDLISQNCKSATQIMRNLFPETDFEVCL